jgi:hypothetical protein
MPGAKHGTSFSPQRGIDLVVDVRGIATCAQGHRLIDSEQGFPLQVTSQVNGTGC